ncbi:MAG: tungsten formylmethanofuran dehydrogenase, partial [SAR324 cluster bacterium]|nr:tungsten formylmethanofuran dehydrogenase [SAR324 cluster bacterium]
AHVVRLQSHSISDNHLKYRSEEELKQEKLSCPILKLNQYLVSNRICSQDYLDSLEVELQNEINGAAEWAEQQPDPKKSDVLMHVYSKDSITPSTEEKAPFGTELFLIDAINQALDEEMSLNPDIYVFGQDVAKRKGGVFGATKGLSEKYGDSRCFNSPLAESSIVGVAIGMALQGLKPVVEIQFGDYTWYAMMQLRNEMAMMRYRSGGEWFCPAVIRIPVGGYIRGASYHSQNIEATFAHFPGLKIVYPSNASDAKGLLKSAIRGEDPVLFLEHKGLYRQNYAKGPVGDPSFTVPIGKAKVLTEGNNATVVTWGALVQKSLLAAKEIEKNGKSIEVIDLRSIVPFDAETVFKSIQKTSRVLIAHEDVQFMGFGAEISAQIAEHCFPYLDAPIRRVGGKQVAAIPQAEALEAAALPQDEDVLEALNALLEY